MSFDEGCVAGAQARLLAHHALYPEDGSHNLAFVFRMSGSLDVERLREALLRILAEVEVFNTTFELSGRHTRAVLHGRYGDGPGRHVVPVRTLPVGGEDELVRTFSRQADEPLPPSCWPLVDVALYDGGAATYLTILVSHLVADAYTFYNVIRGITTLYEDPGAPLPGTPTCPPRPPVSPSSRQRALEAFRQHLSGVATFLPEQLAACRDSRGVIPGRRTGTALEGDDQVRAWTRRTGVSRFEFFLGLHVLLQSTLTGRDDVVVGIPLANRRGRLQREAYGYRVNTLPLAVDVSRHACFTDLCRALSPQVTSLIRNQDFDLPSHAGEGLGLSRDQTVFGSSFTYYKEPLRLSLPGVGIESLELRRRTVVFPLTFSVEDRVDGTVLHLEYAASLAPAGPERLLRSLLAAVLDGGQEADGQETPLRALRAVTAEQVRRIEDLQGPARRYEVADSLATALEAAAARHPDRPAVSDEHGVVTYAELDRRANQLARAIQAQAPGDHVGVALPPDRNLITTLLAIGKAGKAYVPIDPSAPALRAERILGAFEDLPLICATDAFPQLRHAARLSPESLLADADAHPPTPPDRPESPDRTAYVIFTSGSTGLPKGVEVTHRNVLRLFAACDEEYSFTCQDTWSLFHSAAFDFSVWEIFGALLHGARLAVAPERVRRSPMEFFEFLVNEQVTVLSQTPSAFRRTLDVMSRLDGMLLALRYVVFGGEAIRMESLRRWYELAGDRAVLVNMYGITETTVHVTAQRLSPEMASTETRSIVGRPLRDLRIRIVDRHLRPCPIGVTGEILVSGDGVSAGYRNQPELTRSRFLTDLEPETVFYRSGDLGYLLPDGTLVYMGRADRQVQLRGYRIELGEVEAALLNVPGVRECAVRLDEREGVEPRLVGYLVPTGAEVPDTEVRRHLRRRLPPYMVPACLVTVSQFSLTVNGKLDEAALPLPPIPVGARPPAERATGGGTAVEVEVDRIWREVLLVDRLDPDENFFDVGGTSMHIADLHRRMCDRFPIDLEIVDLFEHTTIRSQSLFLAEIIGQR